MEFVTQLVDIAIFTTIAIVWARWSKLHLGLATPAFRRAEPPWVLLFILWIMAEWAIVILLPFDVDPDWLTEMEQLSLVEQLILFVLLGPVSEELFFRGAMFAAILRRWGIWPAALIPSVVWGLIHIQYEWWFVASIVGSGVILAMVRWTSGSIYLCVGLHAAGNLLATLDSHGLLGRNA